MQELGEGTDIGTKRSDCDAIKSLMEHPEELHACECRAHKITSEQSEHLSLERSAFHG